MNVRAIKTDKILAGKSSIFEILDKYVDQLSEGSIVAIASKIVALCEGRVVPVDAVDKDGLIKQEADLYLSKEESRYDLYLTIKNNILAVSAGIDESNTGGYYVLWPKDPQKSANEIRDYLVEKFGLKNVGVIITDSKTTPLRWGVTGIQIAHSGFLALNDLIGAPDVFGRKLKMTKEAIADGLAASAVLAGGEGSEQTPVVVITDIPFVKFQDRNPTTEEIESLRIKIDDDVYAPLLKSAPWKKK